MVFIISLVLMVAFPLTPVQAQGACSGSPATNATDCEEQGGTWLQSATAVGCTSLAGIGNIICKAHQILNSIIPVLVAFGVVYIVWGIVQYVIAGGDEAKKKGRDTIIYGIIGLAVIVGLWGLVNIIVTTFGVGGVSAPSLQPLTGTSSTCSLAGNPKFQDFLCYITRIINNSVIPLIFALAVASFVWGVVQFVINSNEEAKKEKGRQFILWGVIALAVMLSVWGLVGILRTTFNLDTGGSFLPQVHPTR